MIFFYLYCSLSISEWVIHRYFMHRRTFFSSLYVDHTIFHHHNYVEDFSKCKHKSLEHKSLRFNVIWTMVILIPILLIIAYFSLTACLITFLSALSYMLLWNVLHIEMHSPRYNLDRFWIYRFYKNYHYQHHLNPRTNYNVLALGADHLFGTLYHDQRRRNSR